MNFEDLKITRQFLNAIEDQGFSEPTPIQIKAIPPIRSGQDLIGIAQTGTGKTAAYLLPILQTLKYAQGDHVRCLILAPTKELVIQVKTHLDRLTTYCDLRSIALYGGVGPKTQIAELNKGMDIIIATPGRFMEIYNRGEIPPKKIKHLILDEADRMLDMGFIHQLRKIFEVIPNKRQNLLFSATFPPRVETLCDEFLLWPTRVEVTPQATPVETVEQVLYHAPNFRTKLNLLMKLLEDESLKKVIIFVRMKSLADNISRFLDRKELGEIRSIHSNKGQNSRINALEAFRNEDIRILVSTDVSARGIDIPDVSHVINFSVPKDYHDYVHRIGRTGRAFKAGMAITFADHTEIYHLRKIETIINQTIPVIEIPGDVEIEETTKGEKRLQAIEIDKQKRREDPNYKGAFHEKKRKKSSNNQGKRHGKRKG